MAGFPSLGGLRARFAALERLGRSAVRRRIPFVQQVEAADCGAACLAMVLGFHGRETALRETQEILGTGLSGVSARDLLEAARSFGLRTRGVQLDVSDMEQLPAGAILHWGFDHFVIYERMTPRGVAIVDPGSGPREVPLGTIGEKFTGVALIFEPTDDFEHGRRLPGTLGGYVRRLLAHRAVIVRAVVLSAVLQVLGLGLPLLVGVVVDRVVPRRDHGLLTLLAVGMAAVVVFHTLAYLLRSYLLNYLRTALDAQLGLGFMDHLARLGYRYFMTRPSGDLLARFESNRTLRQTLTAASLSALIDGSLVVSYLVLIVVVNLAMGTLIFALGALQIVLFLAFRRPVRALAAQELEAQARSQSRLVEILAGMETLKAAGAEHRAVESWSHHFVDELNVSLARARLGSIAGALSSGVVLASPVAILLVGAAQVLAGNLSLGLMLALNALAAGFLTPLSSLVATAFQLQEVRSHIERIEDVMSAPVEQEPGVRRASVTLTGAIRIEQVSFRYGPREPWVVRDVDFPIPAGAKVAIVGPSGAGKSTLARLLVGLYRPEAGRVTYDDVDLAALDLPSLRSQIGVVTQDARVFGTSIRANIALTDPGAALDDVARAARLAEIHNEIAAMPMGYDTILSDGGASLSGGQRQRLALARALLRRPAILLLDEATSDLDTISERRIMDHLANLACTRVVIAHRLSTVRDADCILVMQDGRVVEQGRHEDLRAAGGVYADLIAAQEARSGGLDPGSAT